MANISEYLNNIKNAILGKDVRQSIHDGINAINEEVTSNTNLTNNTKTRQDILERKYDEQIENIAASEPQSAEIVDARMGQTTLGNLLKKKVYFFESVASMKSCLTLLPGDVVQTLGYYESNDGGQGLYQIVNNNLLNDDGGSVHDLINGLKAKLIIKDSVNVKQFGAKGDGETDDSLSIKNFFAYPCSHYIVEGGTFLINQDIDTFNNNSEITFNNSKIIRAATSSDKYEMFRVYQKSNIVFNNIHLVGDKEIHTGTTGEYGHAFNIIESDNITLNNCIIENTWGDGIYIGYSYYIIPTITTQNITINNCKITNCSRNGIAITSGDNITVENCYIDNINRIDPRACIDIESEHSDEGVLHLNNISINNCILKRKLPSFNNKFKVQ